MTITDPSGNTPVVVPPVDPGTQASGNTPNVVPPTDQETQANGNALQLYDKEQEKLATKSRRNRLVFWLVVLSITVSMFALALMVGEITKIGNYSLKAWLPVFIILCVYTSVSFTTQEEDERGGKFLFRKLIYETGSGLIFTPYGVCTHEVESITVKQNEIPTDVPGLYGKEEDGTPVKYIRMTTDFPPVVNKRSQSKNDPLQTGRLTLNTLITVSFRVSTQPGAFFQYYAKMRNTDIFLGIADDVAVGYVRKQVKEKTPSNVFKDWQDIEDNATALLAEAVKGYGVEDVKITVKEFGLPRDVNVALAKRTAAQTNVETKRLEGEADKKNKLEVAQGTKAMKKAELDGPFEALANAIKDLGFSKEQALFLANQEAVAKMYEKAKYSIVPSGKGGFMDQATVMAVMQEALQASSTHQQGNQNTQGGNTP